MEGQGYSTLEVRVRAVNAVHGGMPVVQAAQAHGVDRTTLHRWLRRHHDDGEAGLQRRPVNGRPRKLQSINGYNLKRIVMAPASRYGFETDLWTVSRIHAVLTTRFNDDVSDDTVWRRLREIGLTWQTPERQYFEADAEVRRRWQEETIPGVTAFPQGCVGGWGNWGKQKTTSEACCRRKTTRAWRPSHDPCTFSRC